MIQRIQTIYLLIVAALLITCMCLPVGTYIDTTGVHVFKTQGVTLYGTYHPTWGLLSVLGLCTLISLATIFLYKNRVLQIRMTVFNSIMMIGYYAVVGAFYFSFRGDAVSFQMHWALGLPLVGVVLNYLAIRAITRDEMMVKAADSFRLR